MRKPQRQKSVMDKRDRKIKNSKRRFRRSNVAPTRTPKTNLMTKIEIPVQVMHLVAEKKRNRPETDQEVTISSPPTATLAGVLVRHNASVEGHKRNNTSKETQEVEERLTSNIITSASGVSNE
jgi:hypothetical protein